MFPIVFACCLIGLIFVVYKLLDKIDVLETETTYLKQKQYKLEEAVARLEEKPKTVLEKYNALRESNN